MRARLLFFVKLPRAGRVKTRLARRIGADAACAAYAAFAADVLAMLDTLGLPLTVCHSPDATREEMAAWLGPERDYRPQTGDDLGERMAESLAWALAGGAERVVLVGSDLPDLPAARVALALESLRTVDAVLQPAGDGGYGLVGFRRQAFRPEVFAGIDWSTPLVMSQSLAAMKRLGLACAVLDPWPDVDEYADLATLTERLRQAPESAPRTRAWLSGGRPGKTT